MKIDIAPGLYEEDIILPRLERGGFVIVDGHGEEIVLGKNSNGFVTDIPEGMSPLSATSTTYIIQNIIIKGGKSAIRLTATFNSVVRNVECIGQSDVAIKAEFALMSRFQNIRITNPVKDGIILSTGDFNGWGTVRNSQCNHSVLDQVRVYNSPHTQGNSFSIIHSNGVVLRDCVSEGHQNAGYGVYYHAPNSTVKNFTIDNFHLEHMPKKGGIYVAAMAHSPVYIRGLFAQGFNSSSPVIEIAYNTFTIIDQCGWWNPRMRIKLTHRAPRLKVRNSNNNLTVNNLDYEGTLFTGYVDIK